MEKFMGGIFAAVLLLFPATSVWAAALDELSPADQASVLAGQTLDFETNADGTDWDESSWPRMTVYKLVHASPEEAIAVMWDFPLQPKYMSAVVAADVKARPAASQAQVEYTVKIPIVGQTKYTVLDSLSTYDNGASYKFACQLVQGDLVKSIDGVSRFEAVKDGTLMVYQSLIIPKMIPATSFTIQAGIDQFKGTVEALGKQIETERTNGTPDDKAMLPLQLQQLRAALLPPKPAQMGFLEFLAP